ncbi:MAG: immunoglobulin domain-containing protein [Phycisphaeraceae bacterium]|nr:immunoglobulin domain-containing protein [Phycisphaeraceae bacterium]
MNKRVWMGVRGGRMWSAFFAAAAVVLVSHAHAQCEGEWLPGMGIPGINGEVDCLLSWDPDGDGPLGNLIVVGGRFTFAGEIAAENIAAWDGERWHPFGAGLRNAQQGGRVLALMVHEGHLIAGGQFQRSGDAVIVGTARWTGVGAGDGSWEEIGGGFGIGQYGQWPVNALAVYNGELIAAGRFSVSQSDPSTPLQRIARWDGAAWRPIGAGLEGQVYALEVYRGELIAGGIIRASGEVPLSGVAAWDGTSWRSLGGGAGGVDAPVVRALRVYRGKLIAGGHFQTAGAVPARRIAAWDGAAWSALGGGAEDGAVNALAVGGGRLYAGGNFTSVDGVPARHIASWSAMTNSWSSLGEGVEPGGVDAIAVAGGCVLAGGRFANAGEVGVNAVAQFCGGQWESLGSGFNAPVLALEKYQGELVAGGWFTRAGESSARGIASFDGVRWRPLGEGLGTPFVRAIAKYQGELIATGGFDTAGGVPVNKIARWDGTRWAPLGSGLTSASTYDSGSRGGYALAVYQGELIVAGFFDLAGGVPARNIARWDGRAWQAIEGARPWGWFTALEVFGNELIVAGRNRAGPASGFRPIAKWDGSDWTWIPGTRPLNPLVIPTMAVFEDRLFLGTNFAGAYTWTADGMQPGPVSISLPSGTARAIEPIQGELFIGPNRWNGEQLVPIPGAPPDVRAIAEYRGHVYFGGAWYTAGDGPSAFLARWRNPVPQIVRQPVSLGAVCIGQNISLNVRVAQGYNDLQFQWRHNGEPIDAPIGTQRVLDLSPLRPTDAGVYDCVVSNPCGSVTSIAAELVLCAADYNCDGSTTGADVTLFYDLWFAGNAAADFNGDGLVDNQDVVDFIAAWQGGCP